MNNTEFIDALRKTQRSHDWDGPIMGNNSIEDFVLGAGAYSPSDEVSQAIREAVSNRIAVALSNEPSNPDDTWLAWCKGEIDVDFSDIQMRGVKSALDVFKPMNASKADLTPLQSSAVLKTRKSYGTKTQLCFHRAYMEREFIKALTPGFR